MIIYLNENISPAYNLAFEEYALTHYTNDNVVMLWRNDKSVIVGNNQNAFEEIDVDFVKQNNISVIRRLTGGGAVFHDLGNVNFTFISDYKQNDFGNYKYFAKPVCEFLKELGLDAEVSGRNDILANGFKVSGNAQTVKNGRILQHGTLLYSADMSFLSKALKPKPLKIQSKGIKSVRSRVSNIKDLLGTQMTVNEFMDKLYAFFLSQDGAQKGIITDDDVKKTAELADEKYGKWEWNFGSSPKFTVKAENKFDFGLVEIYLDVKDGVIDFAKICGDFFGINPVCELENAFKNARFDRKEIEKIIKEKPVCDFINKMTNEQFLKMLF